MDTVSAITGTKYIIVVQVLVGGWHQLWLAQSATNWDANKSSSSNPQLWFKVCQCRQVKIAHPGQKLNTQTAQSQELGLVLSN
jgi:hypothetical protein